MWELRNSSFEQGRWHSNFCMEIISQEKYLSNDASSFINFFYQEFCKVCASIKNHLGLQSYFHLVDKFASWARNLIISKALNIHAFDFIYDPALCSAWIRKPLSVTVYHSSLSRGPLHFRISCSSTINHRSVDLR